MTDTTDPRDRHSRWYRITDTSTDSDGDHYVPVTETDIITPDNDNTMAVVTNAEHARDEYGWLENNRTESDRAYGYWFNHDDQIRIVDAADVPDDHVPDSVLVPDAEDLTDPDEHGKTWFKLDIGTIVYYIPADACDPACDNFSDSDVRYNYEYAVRVGSPDGVEVREDSRTVTNNRPEPMSYRDVRRELEEVME